MPKLDRLPFTLAAILLAAPGCYSDQPARAGDDGDTEAGDTQPPPPGTDTADDDGSSGDTGDAPTPTDECEGAALAVGPAPLRRLTRVELANTVRDVLGPSLVVSDDLPADEALWGYDSNSVKQATPEDVELYFNVAEGIANAAINEHGDILFPCDTAQTACIDGFLGHFGTRLYRRPLSVEERDALLDAYEANRDAYSPMKAIKLMLEAMLASPNFLYVIEFGEPVADAAAVTPLTGYELAARLSYFLWNSAPDDALLAAAEGGELATLDGLEAQARRLLADPHAEDTVADFVEQWLGIRGLAGDVKDTEHYGEWSPALGLAMLEETRRFAVDVVLQGDGKLSTLLTRSTSTIDQDLAAVYGVDWPDELVEALAEVELDPSERAGILTQASVMTRKAHADEGSWVHRGMLVRQQLLCQTLPGPPPDVDMSVLNNPDRTKDNACKGCHLLMDPIGWGADNYDAIGRFDTIFNDADPLGRKRGEVVGSGDPAVDGEFFGMVDLTTRLADSPVAADCFATQWFRYAHKRAETLDDICSLRDLRERFQASGGDVRELLIDLVLSDPFRFIKLDAGA